MRYTFQTFITNFDQAISVLVTVLVTLIDKSNGTDKDPVVEITLTKPISQHQMKINGFSLVYSGLNN